VKRANKIKKALWKASRQPKDNKANLQLRANKTMPKTQASLNKISAVLANNLKNHNKNNHPKTLKTNSPQNIKFSLQPWPI
jgi:hypothetical protein